MKPHKWNKSRRKELAILQELLREVSSINSGNYCLERIKSCIDMAEKLSRSSLEKPRRSFMTFLIAAAAGQEDPEAWS
jgi:hypothetical protein